MTTTAADKSTAFVTAELLATLGACQSQIDHFAKLWPEGCEITPDVLLAAHTAGLNVRWLAEARSTPRAVLEKLAGDVDAWVRGGVARNAATSAAVLEKLAGDVDAGVRGGVARNAATSAAVLEKLAQDESASVQAYALAEIARRAAR